MIFKQNSIKVLFIVRATLYTSPGGDTTQILKTAENLRKLGVEVDIELTTTTVDVSIYDIVHFFNIIRPSDILIHFKKAKRKVISTIFVDYSEAEKNSSSRFRSVLIKYFDQFKIEYFKRIVKAILGKEKLVSKEYLLKGHFKSIEYLYKNADAILPNSFSELNRIQSIFGTTNSICEKVVNGIEIDNSIDANIDFENAIICVARVEDIKNQLNLIKAVNQLEYPLYIIGNPAINTSSYYNKCKEIAGKNIKFINNLNQKEVFSIMKAAKVHVLPSWFETTGLVSLEAAFYGCNIVITNKGDQKEYFENYAHYCIPNDVESIKNAIVKAYNSTFNNDFKHVIETNYTWYNAAQQTKAVYLKLMNSI